jgi:aquaporin Z
MKKLFAEFFGTYWLVFGGCGSALFAAGIPDLGIGFAGVSLAFGLTVLTMAYAVGHISGGHFNPAVSFGLWAGGRFDAKELLPYIISQCVGGLSRGCNALCFIMNGQDSFVLVLDATPKLVLLLPMAMVLFRLLAIQ